MSQYKSWDVSKIIERFDGLGDYATGSELREDEDPTAYQHFENASGKLETEASRQPQNLGIKVMLLEKALECNQRLWTEAEYRQEIGLPWEWKAPRDYFCKIKAIRERIELLQNPKLIN